MTARPGVIGPSLAGRVVESGVVSALLDRAVSGEAGSLLVFGDPGVGKTALVRDACARLDPAALVLPGACLPLASLTVPFLAIRSAVHGARSAGVPLPPVIDPAEAPASVPVRFDAWLDDVCGQRPVVLAIEDLHWADQSTLDVLMYLLAGPAERPLAVITTVRSAAAGAGHPLGRWLADVRRLPRVEQLALDPLDRVATSDQLAEVLGAPAHQSLVEEVFARTRGNPYLNRLLVAGLAPSAPHLPDGLPDGLTAAVLDSWRRLSGPTRELTRILAVGGRPLGVHDLAAVTAAAAGGGGGPDRILPLLREAVDAGVLDALGPQGYWFHHPLIALSLRQDLDDDEATRWHGAFAAFHEQKLTDAAVPAVEALAAVADHHFRAHHGAEAYRWALRAAEAAGAAGGVREMLRLLRRAVDLRDQLAEADESRTELLIRLREAAAAAGAHAEELAALDVLLGELDAGVEPLFAAELLVRRAQLRVATGDAALSVTELREAVRLSRADPASWQHAYALAELAHAGLWDDDVPAADLADDALRIATVAENDRALPYALCAQAAVASATGRTREALGWAARAVAASVGTGDFWAYVNAALAEGEAVDVWSSDAVARHLRMRRVQLAPLGAPHPYIAMLSAEEAGSWLAVGRWRECVDVLRVALGSDPGPSADVSARLAAARLAALQGRPEEAQAHLARAGEVCAGSPGFLDVTFDATRAEVSLAAGDAAAAFDAALDGARSPLLVRTMRDWLVPLAARALADQVAAARDGGGDSGELLARLDEFASRFPAVVSRAGEPTPLRERQVAALDALYRAEVGRARLAADNADDWMRAASACQDGMLAWEEAYACWRGAEALLVRGHGRREVAASVARRGLALAEELQARPVQAELQALADSAHLPTRPITPVAPVVPRPGSMAARLTAREREILDHIAAGRTYAEIARALVISEKTVSSHVSNMLRKTGTSNRIALARLAPEAPGDDTGNASRRRSPP